MIIKYEEMLHLKPNGVFLFFLFIYFFRFYLTPYFFDKTFNIFFKTTATVTNNVKCKGTKSTYKLNYYGTFYYKYSRHSSKSTSNHG